MSRVIRVLKDRLGEYVRPEGLIDGASFRTSGVAEPALQGTDTTDAGR